MSRQRPPGTAASRPGARMLIGAAGPEGSATASPADSPREVSSCAHAGAGASQMAAPKSPSSSNAAASPKSNAKTMHKTIRNLFRRSWRCKYPPGPLKVTFGERMPRMPS